MAVSPKVRDSRSFVESFRNTFTRTLGITDFSGDSKYRTLVEPVANALSEVTQVTQTLYNARQLSSATGKDLDDLAFEVMGSGRLAGTQAFATKESMNVVFYVANGTFGDLFSGSYTVTAGTRIHSDRNQNEQNLSLDFYTTEDVQLERTASAAFIPVRAALVGRLFNIGSHVLRNHTVPLTGLRVTNFYPILNGRDRETDEQLRFRVSRYSGSLMARNTDSVLLSSLDIPGVITSKIISGYYGPGTCAAIILCTEYESNADTLRSVQIRLDKQRIPGLSIIASHAVKNTLNLEITLEVKKNLLAQEKTSFEARLLRDLKDLVKSAGLGGQISKSDMEAIVKRDASNLLAKPTVEKSRIKTLYSSRSTAISYFDSLEIQSETLYLEEDEFADIDTIEVNYIEVA